MTLPPLLAVALFPYRTVAGLREHPRWGVAFVVLSLVSITIVLFASGSRINNAIAHLPPSATAQDRALVQAHLEASVVRDAAFIPFRLLLGWASFTLLLFALGRAFAPPRQVRFLQLFALEVHAEGIMVVAAAAGVLFGANAGSAAWLAPDDSFLVLFLLRSSNIFTLWYVWVLTAGLTALCGFRRRTSFLLAAGALAASLVFNLGLIKFLQGALHLRI